MSPSTRSPTDGETQTAAPLAPHARFRGQRLEITPADLSMYAVITGRAPSREERERALTWGEEDPLHDQVAAGDATAAQSKQALPPWHPAALSLRLRDLWFNGISLRTSRHALGLRARLPSGTGPDTHPRLRQAS